MLKVDQIAPPKLGLSGLDADLSADDLELQQRLNVFATSVMRPVAAELDRLPAAETVQANSPLWRYLQEYDRLGIGPDVLSAMGPARLRTALPIIFEELGYGDSGLAVAAFVSKMPAFAARNTADPELVGRFSGLRGCWIATQPDRGSDAVDLHQFERVPATQTNIGNLVADVGSREIVLNGVSSQWIAGAPIAECALVHCPADAGQGFVREDGRANGVAVLVPFDAPGVSVGRPTEKVGQRALPTGQVVFDNVRIPRKYALKQGDGFHSSFFASHTFGAMDVAAVATGVARAAFDHAMDYAHTREQGGCRLVGHQLVRYRIFEMWRKIECARAMARRAAAFNFSANGPHLLASVAAKVTASALATEVVVEALQMFGANGLSRDYPIEKLLRDVRASGFEGGENNFVSLLGGNWLLRARGAADGDATNAQAGSANATDPPHPGSPQERVGENDERPALA